MSISRLRNKKTVKEIFCVICCIIFAFFLSGYFTYLEAIDQFDKDNVIYEGAEINSTKFSSGQISWQSYPGGEVYTYITKEYNTDVPWQLINFPARLYLNHTGYYLENNSNLPEIISSIPPENIFVALQNKSKYYTQLTDNWTLIKGRVPRGSTKFNIYFKIMMPEILKDGKYLGEYDFKLIVDPDKESYANEQVSKFIPRLKWFLAIISISLVFVYKLIGWTTCKHTNVRKEIYTNEYGKVTRTENICIECNEKINIAIEKEKT